MLSKCLVPIFYLGGIGLVIIFIFGRGGVLDGISQSQEILKLTDMIMQSEAEIEEMSLTCYNLSQMEIPDQLFLIEQGRTMENIVVFKTESELNIPVQIKLSDSIETKIFIHSRILLVGSFLVVVLGLFSLFYINLLSIVYRRQKDLIPERIYK